MARHTPSSVSTAWLLLLTISAAVTTVVDARHLLLLQEPEVTLVGPPVFVPPERAAELDQQAADGAVTTSSVTPAAMDPLYQSMLDLHNQYRALHGAGPLTWDDGLAAKAESWGKQCKWEHYIDGAYGQNLAAYYPTNRAAAGPKSLDGWYTKELPLYNFNKPGWTPAAGHFTQVVWKATTKIGCYAYDCASFAAFGAGQSATMVVCNYSPPGNVVMAGQFEANVLPKGSGNGTSDPPVNPPSPPVDPPGGGGGGNLLKSILLPGRSMTGGVANCLVSPSGSYRFCVATNTGELQVQKKNAATGAWTISWRNRKTGPTSKKPYKLTLSVDGNLAVTDKTGTQIFQSNTSNQASVVLLMMQDSGRASLIDSNMKCLWNC